MSMTKKIQNNLRSGQRFIYTEGRGVKLLIEVKGKPKLDPYGYNVAVPVKILNITRDSYDDFSLGSNSIYTDRGTWTYLEGQDAPKISRKKK